MPSRRAKVLSVASFLGILAITAQAQLVLPNLKQDQLAFGAPEDFGSGGDGTERAPRVAIIGAGAGGELAEEPLRI